MWAQRWQYQCRNIIYCCSVVAPLLRNFTTLKVLSSFFRILLAVFYKLVNVISRIEESLGRPNNIFLKNAPITESLEAIN